MYGNPSELVDYWNVSHALIALMSQEEKTCPSSSPFAAMASHLFDNDQNVAGALTLIALDGKRCHSSSMLAMSSRPPTKKYMDTAWEKERGDDEEHCHHEDDYFSTLTTMGTIMTVLLSDGDGNKNSIVIVLDGKRHHSSSYSSSLLVTDSHPPDEKIISPCSGERVG
jgi:hypothetical protein